MISRSYVYSKLSRMWKVVKKKMIHSPEKNKCDFEFNLMEKWGHSWTRESMNRTCINWALSIFLTLGKSPFYYCLESSYFPCFADKNNYTLEVWSR